MSDVVRYESRLPEPPATAVALWPDGNLIKRSIGRRAPKVLVTSFAWENICEVLRKDSTLRKRRSSTLPSVDGYARPVELGKLSIDSERMLMRMDYLLEEVLSALLQNAGSSVIDDLSRVIQTVAKPLLLDVAADLLLADKLVNESKYKNASKGARLRDAASLCTPGVTELRSRVMYAAEALALIQRVSLQGQAALRLSGPNTSMPQLQDAVEWFKCYAEVQEEMAEKARQKEPPSLWSKLRRRH